MIELSVGVVSVGNLDSLRRCLSELVPQINGEPVEILVPFDSTMEGIDSLRSEYPHVRFIDLGVIRTYDPPGTMSARHELFDRRASAALAAAQGSILSLLQDWGAPNPDWCRHVLAAHHNLPYAAIGGGVEHEGNGILNWAVFLQDFGRYQPPIREGPRKFLTDVNVAYKRRALESVKDLWRDRYNEVTINWTLLRQREVLWQEPRMIVRQNRGRLSFGELLRERASWGRLFGAARAYAVSGPKRFGYLIAGPLIPVVTLVRIARKVWSDGRHRKEFLMAFPALLVLVAIWSAGEFWGMLTRHPSPLGSDRQSRRT